VYPEGRGIGPRPRLHVPTTPATWGVFTTPIRVLIILLPICVVRLEEIDADTRLWFWFHKGATALCSVHITLRFNNFLRTTALSRSATTVRARTAIAHRTR